MIQVLDRALSILDYLGRNPQMEFALSTIASSLSLDKGTCTRIMKTLLEKGYVQQDYPRGKYRLGYKAYHLIGSPVENEELTKIARRDIDELGRRFNETALLAVVKNDRRVVLYSTVPDRNLVIRTKQEGGVYAFCAGRVIIANYTPSHLDKLLIRLGLPSEEEWPEIYRSGNPEQNLINALVQIKNNGYDILDDGNGITGFAAPIFRNGHVAGCVGLYLPNDRMIDRDRILSALLSCSRTIDRKLETEGTRYFTSRPSL
ncbi:MAG: helix-turn-helix domain-containing protein [Bacteroidales bacterium]|nr:helix-turn-helix domain-containing protein [Bacteroidales bacterium]